MVPAYDPEAELREITAAGTDDLIIDEARVVANNPYLWTPAQRAMAGIPETDPAAGGTLPPHVRDMVLEMGRHNSSTSR